MRSDTVSQAVEQIDAALDTLFELDLAALSADELVRLAGRCETLARRQAVLNGDFALQVQRREISELGGAPHKVLADWLRITPAQARRRATLVEPLAPRTSLAGEPLPPHQPATAQAWRAGELDVDHVRVIARFRTDLPIAVTRDERESAESFLAEH
ncbi:MAG: 13E12 repeat family protein, partial [Mycobacterium sp.]|nr:13E12 repeat family protein [Mycobacterium sp.]